MVKVKVPKGKYQHYKTKNFYEVVGGGLHTETEEDLVIYKPLYKNKYDYFARPVKMFLEKVKDPETGKLVPRFKKVK